MANPRCTTCDADVALDAARCWLCGEEQPVLAEVVEELPVANDRLRPWLVHGGIWLAVIVVLLIVAGLLQLESPYYALGFAIVAVPALAIALGGAALGRMLNKPWHPIVKISVGVAIAAVLLPVAAIIALFVACFDALSH